MNEEVKARIRQFLARSLSHIDLQDNDDIFGLGLVNSLFAMQLVLFVEQDFQITVENEDLELDNFRSINALADFVTQKIS